MAITKFNKAAGVDWNFKTEGFEFKKASEMELNKIYPIHGVFTTPDKGYGVGGVVILDDCLLNAPASDVDTIKAILIDEETVAEIKEGKCGVKVYTYQSKKFKRTGYGLEFVTL